MTVQATARGMQRRDRESGAVLVVVMMVMLGLMGLGMTALWLTSGNMQVGANVNLRTNALYVAEAGIEHARAILNDPFFDIPGTLPAMLTGTWAAGLHAKNDIPTALRPLGIGAVMTDQNKVNLYDVAYPPGTFNRGTEVGTGLGTTRMGFYRVWIRNDRAEIRQGSTDATKFTTDTNGMIVIRSQGFVADSVDPISGAPRAVPLTNVILEITLGPNPAARQNPNNPGPPAPVLCNSGKNACDDNNSTQYGIVVGPPP